MSIVVEVISKEMVKPSSPTPHHLRNHKLSFLDQIAPPVYIPLVFFYQTPEKSNHANNKLLKKSLSEVLTRFPPLAGRLNKENSIIVCNDEGAEFIEAEVHLTRLAHLIQDPQMETLKQLLPVQPLLKPNTSEIKNPIMSVKVSSFDCGGTAVAICLSHKIADGTSLVEFIKAWAAMSMSTTTTTTTTSASDYYYFGANYFPPMDLSGSGITGNAGVSAEKISTKRLVFDKEKLAKLKQLVAAQVTNPSRVEAVSAFIWGHFIEAAAETKNLFVGVHAVNLRPRAKPPITEVEQGLGNCWSASFAYLSRGEESRDLVAKLRASIRGVDVEKVRDGEGYLRNLSKTAVDLFKGDTEICNFSSWCRFPMYEVDFGWGKPDWVCTTTLPFKNLVILMSTPSGDGIEAWVNVPERNFQMLQNHYDSVT